MTFANAARTVADRNVGVFKRVNLNIVVILARQAAAAFSLTVICLDHANVGYSAEKYAEFNSKIRF